MMPPPSKRHSRRGRGPRIQLRNPAGLASVIRSALEGTSARKAAEQLRISHHVVSRLALGKQRVLSLSTCHELRRWLGADNMEGLLGVYPDPILADYRRGAPAMRNLLDRKASKVQGIRPSLLAEWQTLAKSDFNRLRAMAAATDPNNEDLAAAAYASAEARMLAPFAYCYPFPFPRLQRTWGDLTTKEKKKWLRGAVDLQLILLRGVRTSDRLAQIHANTTLPRTPAALAAELRARLGGGRDPVVDRKPQRAGRQDVRTPG